MLLSPKFLAASAPIRLNSKCVVARVIDIDPIVCVRRDQVAGGRRASTDRVATEWTPIKSTPSPAGLDPAPLPKGSNPVTSVPM